MVLEHDKPRDLRPEQVTLKYILLRYYEIHGKTRNSQDPIKYAMKDVWKYLGECTVAEFDDVKQRSFHEKLRTAGQSAATIARKLTVVAAALNLAVNDNVIGSAPKVRKPEATISAGVKRFTIDELRKVFAQARTENERTMLLLWTTTLCRPGQVLDLTWDRVDFEDRTIDYKVPGARITNKRRAKVLMCPTLCAWMNAHKSSSYVVRNTRMRGVVPLKGFKNHIRRMIDRAGLKGSAYRIRKAGSSYLANRGVAFVQIQAMLAHKAGDGETHRYVEADLPPILMALEALLEEVAPTWLPLARDLRAARVNPLFAQVAANDPV
jgi:integrase